MQNKTVLLVMDIQKGILSRLPESASLMTKVEQAVAAARGAGVPVVFVRLCFRKGHPEVNAANRLFGPMKGQADLFIEGHETTEMPDSITPKEGEVIVNKKRISGFAGSDLEMILRGYGAENLVMLGLSTSGIVLSTLREALDKDYAVTVLEDACADNKEGMHQFLTQTLFPSYANVTTVDAWAKSL
ncbi:cysteine hydrolase family protein [Taibaiella soli]|nr:cysteine hydrolase [Taibaiella soli]